jgi:hypothetical protein
MLDERDLSQEKKWYYQQMVSTCVKALKRNNFAAHQASDSEEARSIVLDLIPEAATIGFGDSVTLLQTGVTQEIEKRWGERVYNPFKLSPEWELVYSREERNELAKRAISTHVFLTSMNAITLDGKLVNTDGWGNRVGGLVFGPEKVIVVCGANKIVADVDTAIKRIRQVAAPINARRHYLRHGAEQLPCAITGECSDCRHAWRICNFTVTVDFQRPPDEGKEPRINVVLVEEELGI